MRHSRHALAIASLTLSGCLVAPPPLEVPARENPTRWAKQMAAFAAQELKAPPVKGGVVFVGSSSIRLWESLVADMAPVPVVHRGFGGSKLFDAIYYSEQLVSVHEPSLVVIFSGTNDIAGKNAKSAVEVRDLFQHLVERLRWADKDLTICHIAITPTLAREEHIPTVHKANRLIRAYCNTDPHLEFIDPSVDLLDATGRPDSQWFQKDLLHLNKRGYEIWTRHIRPLVHRLYERR